jgi:glycogen operon protein
MENLTLAWLPGKPWPLGATWDGKGVNFAVFSANAHRIEVCLYDATGTIEKTRWTLSHFAADVWHGYLPDAQPGLVYGLRAYGPWSPSSGHRFNHNKLLLDPYAREIVGDYTWQDVHFGGIANDPNTMDERDNGSVALKARVVHDSFDWENDAPPLIAAEDTVLYELHVKGFSKQNPDVPEALRGSFAGLSHDASIAHLKALGVTSLSLLPVHYAIDELHLARLELSNYWGYNTLGFFSPSTKLASGFNDLSARDEFRTMVKSLHAAGFEVLIDVVYNHTAESDETGPTLSYRGLDNLNYYRLRVDDLSHHENHSGCGNTLDIRHPRVLQMVMDSLRYWVTDMHVDGFRFDLAPVLGRGDHGFDRLATFFFRHCARPHPLTCQARGRTVGHRTKGLSAWRVPRWMVRVERSIS